MKMPNKFKEKRKRILKNKVGTLKGETYDVIKKDEKYYVLYDNDNTLCGDGNLSEEDIDFDDNTCEKE
jgi:hypothetical protein